MSSLNFIAVPGTIALLAVNIANLPQAIANEVYLDQNCRQNQQLPITDKAIVFYKSEFSVKGQQYLLSAARYQDGATLFCLSKPNFLQSNPLANAEAIQNQFIDKIVKISNENSAFLIRVREGNGSNVPTTTYRLNLSNPNRPILAKTTSIRTPKGGAFIRG